MITYVRATTIPGIEPTWHRLVAHAGCLTHAYGRCRPGIHFHIDATTRELPDGRVCMPCSYVAEIPLPVDDDRRIVVPIAEDVFREVGTGALLETARRNGGAPYVWRTRPEYTWWGP